MEEEDQLIELETVKLAKEKGFNPTIISEWHEEGEHLYEKPITKSSLKTWLRKVHKIDVSVNRDYDGWCWKITEFSKGNKFIKGGSCERPSYETELELGLQEALKLINR